MESPLPGGRDRMERGACLAGSRSGRNRVRARTARARRYKRSEEHTSELQSPCNLVCRLLLEKKTYTHVARLFNPRKTAFSPYALGTATLDVPAAVQSLRRNLRCSYPGAPLFRSSVQASTLSL